MEKHRPQSNEDVLKILDSFLSDEEVRWNQFFTNLPDDHSLSTTIPDENLVSFLSKDTLSSVSYTHLTLPTKA